MRAILLLLLLTGCEDLLAPTDDTGLSVGGTGDSTGEGDCPANWVEPSSVSVNVRNMALDTVSQAAAFLDEPYNDSAPACIANDGSKIRILLGVSGEPVAWFESSADNAVNSTLVDAAGVTVDVIGTDLENDFSQAAWASGTWVIDNQDPGWRHVVNGQGRNGLSSLVLFIEVDVQP